MKLDNHIVTRLLTDPNLWTEMIISQAEIEGKTIEELTNGDVGNYVGMYQLLNDKGNKTYYVTQSVLDKLDLLDTKKCIDLEGWKLFKSVPDFKKTFIFPQENKCLRVFKKDGLIYFCHIEFTFHKKEERTKTDDGELYWILLFVDLDNNRIADHWLSADGNRVAPFLYALMCYVLLCENEEILLPVKAKYGTQKQGKIINTTPFPITIINNTWNTTTIRSEGFMVCGHSAIYWTGPGRTVPKLLYIEPYQKSGYRRKSGKELSGS